MADRSRVEHDTVIQHNTVLAGTAHPAFVPPWLLKEPTDQEMLSGLTSTHSDVTEVGAS